jgi:hypothetical protein
VDVVKLAQIVMRRWRIVVPLLVLGVAVAFLTASRIPADYSTTFSLLVVNQNTDVPEVTPAVLAASMQDPSSVRGVKIGASESYSVSAGDDDIIRVSATASSRAAAARLSNDVLDHLAPTLESQRRELHLTGDGPTLQILSRAGQGSATPAVVGYEAVSSARLVPPPGASAVTGLSKLLAAAMATGQTAVEIQAEGGSTTYQMTAAKDLPLVTATIKGQSPDAVTATATALTVSAQPRLAELLDLSDQSPGTATVKPLGPPAQPQQDSKGIFRALVALLALTAAVAVVAAMLIESLYEHRDRTRRPARRELPSNGSAVGSRTIHDAGDTALHPPSQTPSNVLVRGIPAASQDQ